LLSAVSDPGMGYASRMEPEEVVVLCHYNTSGGCGESKVSHIGSANQPGIRCRRHVDVPAPQGGCDVGRNVFVKMKANGHRSGRFFQPLPTQLRFEHGRMAAAELLRKRALLPHLLLDLLDVTEVV